MSFCRSPDRLSQWLEYGANLRLKKSWASNKKAVASQAQIPSDLNLLSRSQDEMKGGVDVSAAPQRCCLHEQERETPSKLGFRCSANSRCFLHERLFG